MNATDTLAAHGIVRPAEVLELAAAARLDPAAAAVLLEKESGGGRNVWGHDGVPTGGSYDKGGAVTRDNYLAYRAAIRAGKAGRQGCGPTQLTYGPFQDAADALGGCWDWRANCLTGFRLLAGLIRQYGEPLGFRAYNGSGPAADRYAADAVTRLKTWRARLAGTETPPVTLTQQEIQAIADTVWRRPTVNFKGDVPVAETILSATEGRVSAAQDQIAEILDLVKQLVAKHGV